MFTKTLRAQIKQLKEITEQSDIMIVSTLMFLEWDFNKSINFLIEAQDFLCDDLIPKYRRQAAEKLLKQEEETSKNALSSIFNVSNSFNSTNQKNQVQQIKQITKQSELIIVSTLMFFEWDMNKSIEFLVEAKDYLCEGLIPKHRKEAAQIFLNQEEEASNDVLLDASNDSDQFQLTQNQRAQIKKLKQITQKSEVMIVLILMYFQWDTEKSKDFILNQRELLNEDLIPENQRKVAEKLLQQEEVEEEEANDDLSETLKFQKQQNKLTQNQKDQIKLLKQQTQRSETQIVSILMCCDWNMKQTMDFIVNAGELLRDDLIPQDKIKAAEQLLEQEQEELNQALLNGIY